jgi:hypothetical protein
MSTAFWDAFWAGLACPTQLYASRHDKNYKQFGRVDTAWKKVGGYIYGSIDSMADDIDNRKSDKRAR